MSALIPLDGTDLSESAFGLLPFLKAVGFDEVKLVSVWEHAWEEMELQGRREGELKEVDDRGRAYLDAYLAKQADRVKGMGFNVSTFIRVGKAADETLKVADSEKADLILIATHGRDGLARFRLGSVADRIVRSANCPTLVIGPNVDVQLAPYALKRVLVPLDGGALAEEALPLAAWIAERDGAELDLVRAVSLTPVTYDQSMGGVYPMDLLSAMEDAAKTYLQRMAQTYASKIKVSTSLLVGSAADQLLEYLKERPAGLVVMASRGRTGLVRAALGSVTDRMLQGPAPVLILRLDEDVKSRLMDAARSTA
jgi:nucleotide-binding universal stress UspA family protein